MIDETTISTHYSKGSLLEAIESGVRAAGKSLDSITVSDLGPVEEFHIGGRTASEHFLDQLELTATDHVLDAGCGLGGTSRFLADHYGCRVTGIDLTPEFIATGRVLSAWVGLEDRVTLDHGSATALPYADASFDHACMLHVGMNIPDKAALAREVFRVLRPGGRFGIYDVMQADAGELTYPVPWAGSAAGSALASPATYRTALAAAGFEIRAEQDRREFAHEFFAALAARTTGAAGPPPLGLHLVMGADTAVKIRNMIDNLNRGLITPVELIAAKP